MVHLMQERNLDILGLAETWWRDEGRKLLFEDYQVIYKGAMMHHMGSDLL